MEDCCIPAGSEKVVTAKITGPWDREDGLCGIIESIPENENKGGFRVGRGIVCPDGRGRTPVILLNTGEEPLWLRENMRLGTIESIGQDREGANVRKNENNTGPGTLDGGRPPTVGQASEPFPRRPPPRLGLSATRTQPARTESRVRRGRRANHRARREKGDRPVLHIKGRHRPSRTRQKEYTEPSIWRPKE